MSADYEGVLMTVMGLSLSDSAVRTEALKRWVISSAGAMEVTWSWATEAHSGGQREPTTMANGCLTATPNGCLTAVSNGSPVYC